MGGIGDINRTAKSEEDVVEVKMRNYVPRGGGGFGGGKGGTHDDVVAGLSSPLGSMTTRILPNAKAPHLSTTTTTLFLSSEKRGGKDDDVNDDVNDDDDDDGGKGEAKKRNWDLKRDVARRMEKLDRETKRAVAELARDEEEEQQQQQQQQQHE